jgi:predicted HNH restriction endonuclease
MGSRRICLVSDAQKSEPATSLAYEFRRAYCDFSETQKEILSILGQTSDHGATATEIGREFGVHHLLISAAFSKADRLAESILGRHPDGLSAGEYDGWSAIAIGERVRNRGFVWRLRDEVLAELRSGISSAFDDSRRYPDEAEPGLRYPEGAVSRVTVNRYERIPEARAACLAHFGPRCSCCGMSFESTYGHDMAGFIHVHHLAPLSSLPSGYEIESARDLRPVCPNCHAVIHRTDPPRTIEEVKQLLEIAANAKPRNALPD